MSKVEALIEEARQLSASDRRRLIDEVQRSFKSSGGTEAPSYAALLSLAGTAASDFNDVSIDKYPHVAESLSTPRED